MRQVLDAIGEENKLNAIKEQQRKAYNPEDFNDPLALKVNWEAQKYKSSSSSGRKFKISSNNPDIGIFSISNAAVIFCFIFMLVGLGAIVLALWLLINKDFDIFPVVLGFLGLCFFSPVFFILIFNLKTKVFDKNIGYFWEEGFFSNHKQGGRKSKHIHLDEIHAIQLLKDSNICEENPSFSFFNFELNLVFKDATTITVDVYGQRDFLIKQANALAEFLQVPVWDAT